MSATGSDGVNHEQHPYPSPLARLRRFWRHLVTLVLLGIAVHLLLPQLATFGHSLDVVRKLKIWARTLAVLAQLCSYLSSGNWPNGITAMEGRVEIVLTTLQLVGTDPLEARVEKMERAVKL